MRLRVKTGVLFATLVGALLISGPASAVTCPGPDAFGHGCSNPASCVFEATTTALALTDDSCTVVNLPFDLVFYGVSYTQVGVGSNGYLVAGSCTGGTNFSNDCPVPNTIDPDNIIAGVWDDLNPGSGGTVRHGNPAPDLFVVEWDAVPHFSGGGTATFQIQIFDEGAGNESTIRVNVADVGQADCTSGLENIDASDGISSHCNNCVSNVCTEYSSAPTPPTGGCDLVPVLAAIDLLEVKNDIIEAKLDASLDVAVSTRASQASVDALSVKLDLMVSIVSGLEAKQCEIIRMLLTPQGNRASNCCGPLVEFPGGKGIPSCEEEEDPDVDQ